MPNQGIHYCPYYMTDHGMTITCEDTIRRFSSSKNKQLWMDKHCKRRKNWCRCQYAKALDELYRRTDCMSFQEGEIEYLKFCNESKRAEQNKLLSALGVADRKIRRSNGCKD